MPEQLRPESKDLDEAATTIPNSSFEQSFHPQSRDAPFHGLTLNPKPLTYNPIPRRYTQTMQSANMIFYVIGAIVIVLFILLLVNMLLMRNKLNRLAKKYKYFMNGEDGGSLELRLSTEVRELREMVSSSENMLHQQELLATMQLSSFQKVGLVRYDAFDDTGDKLSFSLTVLDGKNNGFILSSLAGHDTSRIYAKQIVNGQCKEALSSEEAESINMALDTLMPDMASEAQELVNETRGEALSKSQPDNHRIDTAGK